MTPRHFAWQAWHLVTSTFVWRGRRGTISHPPSFCVAGVALLALGGALGWVFVAGDAATMMTMMTKMVMVVVVVWVWVSFIFTTPDAPNVNELGHQPYQLVPGPGG